MARSDQRVATALQALVTLDELADQPISSIVRDAAIQRFEYTFEATWKAAQAVLLERYGIELASPIPTTKNWPTRYSRRSPTIDGCCANG